MKRLAKIMVVAALAISPLLVGAPAAAQQLNCDVGFTGPDSNNMCTSSTTYSCEVTNTNTVVISNENDQEVASGSVSVSGNTTGGNGTSGTVSNTNGTTFNVTITNADPDTQELGVCMAAVVVPATETPEKEVTPPGKGQAEALPYTSSDTTLQTTAIVAGALLIVAALSLGGVLWYRHSKAL